jgi:hypothetical protein
MKSLVSGRPLNSELGLLRASQLGTDVYADITACSSRRHICIAGKLLTVTQKHVVLVIVIYLYIHSVLLVVGGSKILDNEGVALLEYALCSSAGPRRHSMEFNNLVR